MLFDPENLLPPHRVTHPAYVDELAASMAQEGWHGDELIGYHVHGQWGPVQLLSGTHRCAAAIRAGIPVPVQVYNRATIDRAWGNLEQWNGLMRGELPDLC